MDDSGQQSAQLARDTDNWKKCKMRILNFVKTMLFKKDCARAELNKVGSSNADSAEPVRQSLGAEFLSASSLISVRYTSRPLTGM